MLAQQAWLLDVYMQPKQSSRAMLWAVGAQGLTLYTASNSGLPAARCAWSRTMTQGGPEGGHNAAPWQQHTCYEAPGRHHLVHR